MKYRGRLTLHNILIYCSLQFYSLSRYLSLFFTGSPQQEQEHQDAITPDDNTSVVNFQNCQKRTTAEDSTSSGSVSPPLITSDGPPQPDQNRKYIINTPDSNLSGPGAHFSVPGVRSLRLVMADDDIEHSIPTTFIQDPANANNER